jgi:hypothetical protein
VRPLLLLQPAFDGVRLEDQLLHVKLLRGSGSRRGKGGREG